MLSLEYIMENPIAPSSQRARLPDLKPVGESQGGQGTGRSGPESLDDDDRMEEISAQNRYTLNSHHTFSISIWDDLFLLKHSGSLGKLIDSGEVLLCSRPKSELLLEGHWEYITRASSVPLFS